MFDLLLKSGFCDKRKLDNLFFMNVVVKDKFTKNTQ